VTVVEVQDPTTALLAPGAPAENFADSLRWKAGPLLGGLDWLAVQIFDYSFIAELVEPLAGDWTGLEQGAEAWQRAGQASAAVGANYAAAAADALASWSGEAADAFSARAAAIGDSFVEYADGCSAMSEVTAALLELCKATAESLAGILGFVGDYLTRLLAEASVPVAGWVVGAIDGVVSGTMLANKLQQGYRLLQRVLDAIESFRDVIAALQRIAYTITLLARATTNVVNVQTVASAPGVTGTAFGVPR
jgi:hypothetical protein